MKIAEFRKIWIGNSFANLIAGGSKALFDFAVPAIVARSMTRDDFSQWNLVLQIAAFVYIFGFGLQTAIAKFLAIPDSPSELGYRNRTLNVAIVLVFAATVMAIIFVTASIFVYPQLFSDSPFENVKSFQYAVALIGFSACAQIISLLPVGVFMGLHQNFVFAVPQTIVRGVTVLLLWVACNNKADFLEISIVYAIGTALFLPLIMIAMFKLQPWTRPQHWILPERDKLLRVLKYCGNISVSMIAMLMITSASVMIVGYFDYKMTGQFALAITASTVIGGLLNSILSPLVPLIARVSQENPHGLASLLLKTTIATVLLLSFILLLFFNFGHELLNVWVGVGYASTAYPLILILFVANIIRFAFFPYATFLLAISMHERTVHSAIVEGVTNVLASLILVRHFGAVGVAYGTVIGGFFGMLVHYFVNFNKTKMLIPNRRIFIFKSIAIPVLCASPIFIVSWYFFHA